MGRGFTRIDPRDPRPELVAAVGCVVIFAAQDFVRE